MHNATNKIRILHFTYSIKGGGAERQLVNLVNGMDENCFENAICSILPQDRSQTKLQIPVFAIPRRYRLDLRWRPLHDLFINWRPHIAHIWSPFVIGTVVPISRLYTNTILLSSYRITERLDNLIQIIHAAGLLFVNKIVSNVYEEDMVTPFKQLFKYKAGEVIPNGMEVEAIQAAAPIQANELGIDPGFPKIIYVGRLVPHKNTRLLIHALSSLKNHFNLECQLVICGVGVEREALQSMAETLGIADHVHFLGFRDDIYRILKSCDVMVLPSFLEGMPNVIFEGMIAKIPVIASDIPVHRRWIQHRHNGLLFDPRDAGSLAESIHEILTMAPETRVKLIWEAFKIGSEFNVAHMITSYEKLYSRLAPGGIQRLG